MPGDFESSEQATVLDHRDSSWTIDHRFQITRVLGEGGMGVVYEAVQLSVGRPVAIKMLLSNDPMHRKRMLREIQLLTQLDHPNIVNVLDGGETADGSVYLVMERIVGPTLAEKLARERMSWRNACDIAVQICDALETSHVRGIVHRDLKPGNIMLVDEPTRGDLVKVLDFGIAKAIETDGQRTSEVTIVGTIVGTPHYMAPEAIEGGLDPRSDLYALGCILYEMLAGTVPFAHATPESVLWHQLRESPPPLPNETPPALAALTYALLLKDPRYRPASAAIVREALLSVLVPPPAVTRAPAPAAPPAQRVNAWIRPIAILLGLMLVAFVVTLQCA